MKYIVLDLEWNQCPYGKEKENKDLPFEIIEVGAVRMDERLQIEDTFERVVRPKVYRSLHYMSREVTKISKKDLKNGASFPEVMAEFLAWCGDSYLFCTWGSLDLVELQRNMRFYHMEPFATPLFYLDIQKLFSIAFEDGKTRRSLKWAVDDRKIKESVPYHRADSDAYYTAMVMQAMPFEAVKRWISVDYFQPPRTRREEIHLTFDNYYKYVSRIFPTREEARKDREVVATRCYVCGRGAKKIVRWYSDNNKIYNGLAACPEHGYIKGKMRVKRAEQGGYFVVKTLKLVTEERAAAFIERKQEKREKKKQKNKT